MINSKIVWSKIINDLSLNTKEFKTLGKGLWFLASIVDRKKIFVQYAKINSPSCNLTIGRSISEDDFEYVYSYYERWKNGEKGIRYLISRKSRNTAYILTLINAYL